MNCPACGAENRAGAHFCRRCGAALEEVSAPAAELEIVESVVDQPEEPAGEPGRPPDAEDEPAAEAPPVKVPAAEALPTAEQPVAGEPPVDEPKAEEVPAEGAPTARSASTTRSAPAVSDPEAAGAGDLPQAGPVAAGAAQADAQDLPAAPGEPAPAGAPEPDVEEAPRPPEWSPADDDESEPLPEPDDDLLGFWRIGQEPLSPVEPGTVVAGRYVVVEALDVQEDEILYHARDLKRCWQCGFEGDAPEDAYCAQCGAARDRKPDVELLEVQDAEAEPASGQEVAALVTHEDRVFFLLAEPEPAARVRPAVEILRLVYGQRSDAGLLRELNEDSLLALTLSPTYESRTGPVLGLFAVADGMGGHEGGEVASKLALQVLADEAMGSILRPAAAGDLALEEDVVIRLRQALIAANDAVYLSRQKRENDMGTTLTAALVRDGWLFLAHVGDCRAYRWNADGLQQLTVDHSVVASMIADGQAAPEEIYTHPHRSIIYRCVGDKPLVDVDADMLPLAPGDRVLLCSDGLWEMVREEGIRDAMLQEADPQRACDLLVRHANAAGGDDNISVIVVQVEVV